MSDEVSPIGRIETAVVPGCRYRPFEEHDIEEYNAWRIARGQRAVRLEQLPHHDQTRGEFWRPASSIEGLIVPGIAAGFLYLTYSTVALLDGFVSNPFAASHARRDALLAIADGILQDCEFLASMELARDLVVYTSHPSIARWAREHGFTPGETHTLYTRAT